MGRVTQSWQQWNRFVSLFDLWGKKHDKHLEWKVLPVTFLSSRYAVLILREAPGYKPLPKPLTPVKRKQS